MGFGIWGGIQNYYPAAKPENQNTKMCVFVQFFATFTHRITAQNLQKILIIAKTKLFLYK